MLLKLVQVILAVLLIGSILLQNRGTGLSGVFGGGGNVYMAKRGLEKKLFYATIFFAVLFFGISLLNVLM
jgi:protein translocase SecG subunit